jgi:hypothetical protein
MLLQESSLAQDHRPRLVGLKQPLVRIEAERVAFRESIEEVGPGRDDRPGAEGAVDVKPEIAASREIGEVPKRVDRAGVGRPALATTAKGRSPRSRSERMAASSKSRSRRKSSPAGSFLN